MRKTFARIAALVLYGLFAASSGAFAFAQEEPAANQRYQCTVNWKAGSEQCKSQGTTSACTTNYQGDHASAAEAKERCESFMGVQLGISGVESCDSCTVINKAQNDCVEHCKDMCLKLWEKCREDCPRKDRNCLSECSNTLGRCNRECDRKCR